MYVDTTNLSENNNCYEITSKDTIRGYNTNNDTYIDYTILSNSYYDTRHGTFTPPLNNDITCYTLEDISKIPSPYDDMTPIYQNMAIAVVLIIFYAAYRLIIYPFFRKI